MIIAKLVCTRCGKKFKSHTRHQINPSFNYVGVLSRFILSPVDINKLKEVKAEELESWRKEFPHGMLVLSYNKSVSSSLIRTECDICNGILKAFAMWVPDNEYRNTDSN